MLIICLESTTSKWKSQDINSKSRTAVPPAPASDLLCGPGKFRHTVGSASKKAGMETLEHFVSFLKRGALLAFAPLLKGPC